MTHELLYTSAPRGLKPGTQGFCTVAATAGLPSVLAERLEALSAYQPLFPPADPNARLNPVAHSHVRLSIAGRTYHVLSRICAAGLDYSQRSNKFAHHIVLESPELPPGGPAWLLRHPQFMEQAWDGQVRTIPSGRSAPQGDRPPRICSAWQRLTGDAGWAGVLAESFEHDPSRPVDLLFQPGTDVLPLMEEAIALLPPRRRWEVTFATYYTSIPQGVDCAWRALPLGTPEAKAASAARNHLVITLGQPLSRAQGNGLVEQARTGFVPVAPTIPPTAAPSPPTRHAPPAPGLAPERSGTRVRVAHRSAAPPQREALTIPTAEFDVDASAPGTPPPLPRRSSRTQDDPSARTWLAGLGGLLVGLLLAFGVVALGVANHTLEMHGASTAPSPPAADPAPVSQAVAEPADAAFARAVRAYRQRIVNARSSQDRIAALTAGENTGDPVELRDIQRAILVTVEELKPLRSSPVPQSYQPPVKPPSGSSSTVAVAPKGSRSPENPSAVQVRSPERRSPEKQGPQPIRLDTWTSTLPPGQETRDIALPLPPLGPEFVNGRWEFEFFPGSVDEDKIYPKTEASDQLTVYQSDPSAKAPRKLATFTHRGQNLLFRWEDLTPEAADARRTLRNAVLRISSNTPQPLNLSFLCITKLRMQSLPLEFDLSRPLRAPLTLERPTEETSLRPLYIAWIDCSFNGPPQRIPAAEDAQELTWGQNATFRLQEQDNAWQLAVKPAAASAVGNASDVLRVHGFCLYAKIGRLRVPVWRIDDKSESGRSTR